MWAAPCTSRSPWDCTYEIGNTHFNDIKIFDDIVSMEDGSACFHQIKHVKWQQGGSSSADSTVPIILQDVNGPCPLIAIFNILLLRGSINLPNGIGEISQVGLDESTRIQLNGVRFDRS